MTIAISIKVNDGIVLASDSAATLIGRDPSGRASVFNIYENADKVFNLKKGSPIGAITWGSGSIGNSSISTLVKDFRKRITNPNSDLKFNAENYGIQEVVKLFKDFFYEENYSPAYKDWKKEQKPRLGFIIAGYSSGEDLAEEWRFDIIKGECSEPQMVRKKEVAGISWNGEIEAIHRLYFGFSPGLANLLKNMGFDDKKISEVINQCRMQLRLPMVVPAMPIQDAIDLAKYLVEFTIQCSKFSPGAPVVGGPIDIAVITKHEHFKWVQRKYYYNTKFNPK